MRLFLAVMLVLSLSFVYISCDKDKVTDSGSNTDSGSDLVKVKVDLVDGFQNNPLSVEFNNDVYFKANLSGLSPLAGPLATFTTYLPRGSNQCKVLWGGQGTGTTFHMDSTDVSFGNLEKYYMLIGVWSNTLDVRVLENSMGYE